MKKKTILIGILVFTILLGAGGLLSTLRQPDPTKTLTEGLDTLLQANSFVFQMTQQQMVQGKERLLNNISGTKNGQDIHIQGQLAGSEVEMIKIGETLYNKDPFSKRWVKYEDITIAQKVFLVELDPLATLQIKELGEVMPRGETVLDDQKCLVYFIQPSIQNQLMERFWTDFEYTFYMAKRSKNIVKVEVGAKNKERGEPMKISLEFKDFNKKFDIQPPQVSKK